MTPREYDVCRAVERHIPKSRRRGIGHAPRRIAVPTIIALGEAAAALSVYLPLRCPEQKRVDEVLAAIERAVANTPAGRRWMREP